MNQNKQEHTPFLFFLHFFSVYSGRSEMAFQRVLQVDLKMESFPVPLGSRWMAWQVEYPVSRAATQEIETEIRLAQEDLAGIVPLAMVIHSTSSLVTYPHTAAHTPCLCIPYSFDLIFLFNAWNGKEPLH